MKAARTSKLEEEREVLEKDYRDALLTLLHRCADGQWGMFGQNDLSKLPAGLQERLQPEGLRELEELSSAIDSLRQKLGYVEPFALAQRLTDYTKRTGGNELGEPRLAREFLKELTSVE